MCILTIEKLLLKIISEGKEETISHDQINGFIKSNPEQYQVYSLLGDYFAYREDQSKALIYYNISLEKEIATFNERDDINNKILQLSNND